MSEDIPNPPSAEEELAQSPGETVETAHHPRAVPEQIVEISDVARMRRMSRRSFVWSIGALAAVYGGWRWINSPPDVDGIRGPFRYALMFNEKVWEGLFAPARLVPVYPLDRVTDEHVNGDEGMQDDDFDPADWKLRLLGVHGHKDAIEVTIEEIKAMTPMTMTTEFFCIEGWSVIQTFKGVSMREFMKKYPPATLSGAAPDLENKPKDLMPYVAMKTPDGGYYVGLDMPSVIHPQTMLCYEMNGKDLTLDHGAPLRLTIPVKYGVKNIKRIGTISFQSKRPPDYWAEQGYDWFAGL